MDSISFIVPVREKPTIGYYARVRGYKATASCTGSAMVAAQRAAEKAFRQYAEKEGLAAPKEIEISVQCLGKGTQRYTTEFKATWKRGEQIQDGSQWKNKKTGNIVTVLNQFRLEEVKSDFVTFSSPNSKVTHQSERSSFLIRYAPHLTK